MFKGLEGLWKEFSENACNNPYKLMPVEFVNNEEDFKHELKEVLESPFLKEVFYITLSALFSSKNLDQFLKTLTKFLKIFWSKFGEYQDINFIEDPFFISFVEYYGYGFDLLKKSVMDGELQLIYPIIKYVYNKVENSIK